LYICDGIGIDIDGFRKGPTTASEKSDLHFWSSQESSYKEATMHLVGEDQPGNFYHVFLGDLEKISGGVILDIDNGYNI